MEVSEVLPWALGGAGGLLVAAGVRRYVADRTYRYPDEREFEVPRQWWLYPVSALLLAALVWRHWERPATLAVFLLLSVPLLALAAIDQDVHRLPDRITKPLYPVLAVMLLLPAAVEGDWWGYLRALGAAAVAFAAFYLLALIGRGGLGWGDVKLAGVLGMALGWFSWTALAVGLVAGFFLGAFWGVGLMLLGRATRKSYIPFGPFLIVGALGAMAVLS